jgi:hypothetical protein
MQRSCCRCVEVRAYRYARRMRKVSTPLNEWMALAFNVIPYEADMLPERLVGA